MPRSKKLHKASAALALTNRSPKWDERLHTLFLHGTAIKHFKLAAACQEAVLAAFERSGWPQVIDLASAVPSEPFSKTRIRVTIQNLNRSVHPHLHFWQEGGGTRVGWQVVATAKQLQNRYRIATQSLLNNNA